MNYEPLGNVYVDAGKSLLQSGVQIYDSYVNLETARLQSSSTLEAARINLEVAKLGLTNAQGKLEQIKQGEKGLSSTSRNALAIGAVATAGLLLSQLG